jgi:hypothetical protein
MFGLFSSKKETDSKVEVASEPTKNAFTKTTLTTQNLSKDLAALAAKHKISVKSLDFKILSYKTFCKLAYGEIFKEVTELNRDEVFTRENFVNPDMALYQELKLEVFQKEGNKTSPLDISIGANKAMTSIKAKVKAQKEIAYEEGLEAEIFAELDKKKAKAGILLGIMDNMAKRGIHKVISAIRVNGGLEEDMKFEICRGIDVINAGGEEIIYHYRENAQGEMDEHASMMGVKEGDVVVEVRKKVNGQKGRNCKGELIDETTAELSLEMVPVTVSEDFEVKEQEDSILYIAKVDGYVYEEKTHNFEIKGEYIVDAVSLKSTGAINVGQDKDIKITVQQTDSSSDAVGAGMKIDTSEIKVAGNVANSAEILAKKVEIEGQTHQSSKIIAEDINIHLHKGYAEGDVVKVGILEGGKIVGDVVHIEQLFGGEIEAKEVYIQKVLSNALVTASHHIEIDEIEGTGNKFIIDARVQRGYHEKNEKLISEIALLEVEVKKLAKAVKIQRDKIKQEEQNSIDINKKVKELKAAGVKPPAGLILKLKDYQERIKKHNSLLKELKDAKIQKTSLQEALSELNSSVYEAKVIHKSVWKEFNEVKYMLLDPPIEVSFLAKEGEIMETLSLAADEEGEFTVKRQG